MIGYLKPDFKELPSKERKQFRKKYRAVYCGLCHCLKERYGSFAISCVSYEISSVLLILLSMREEEPRIFHGSCTITPFVPVPYVDYLSDDFRAAAAISMFIIEQEIGDNIADGEGARWTFADRLLRRTFRKAQGDLPYLDDQALFSVAAYYELEHSPNSVLEELVGACGTMIADMFAPFFARDYAEYFDELLRLADALGRWLYLMDACDDAEEDWEQGKFNPLFSGTDSECLRLMLKSLLEEVAECIHSLPIHVNRELVEYLFCDNLKRTTETVFEKYAGWLENCRKRKEA